MFGVQILFQAKGKIAERGVTSEQPSYAEVVSIEKTILPASTGLEDDLAKLSTNTVETAENPEVDNVCEDQLEAVAGPGKGNRPDPKQAAKEKRKRKRQAAKAAVAATKAKAVDVAERVVSLFWFSLVC
jgi:hypothetical protein